MEDLLTEERLRSVIELALGVVREGRAFRVFPPTEVVREPALLERDDAAAKLVGTPWWLRFADGAEQLLTFPELMILTHNLVGLLSRARGRPPAAFAASVPDLLNPAAVRFLLDKLDLEGVPRERYVPTFPLYGVHAGEAGATLQLQGCVDPDTGLDVVFAFTDRDAADRLATRVPGASAVLLAADVGQLKTLLASTAARAVAFDPAFVGGRIRARHTLLVPAILAT